MYLDGYEAAPVLLKKGVSPYSNNFTGELVGIQIFIRFGSKLYRQIVGIPMGTNCAPLVADLFLFCYDFMLSQSDNNQNDIIEAFNSTSRYLDNLLNIDNPYFEQMVGQIYPTELQLNKANSSHTEAPFLDSVLLFVTLCPF